MKSVIYIGVDDTDILGEPPGTGKVARGLARHLESLGLGSSLGVSRHQLLVDPRIRYTSHNSSLCIAMETAAEFSEFITPCVDYVGTYYKNGADPGLCLCPRSAINGEIEGFGWKATREFLNKQEAIELVANKWVFLKELGGTGEGVIGALAAVGLRADGNQGRFVDLSGIRKITGAISVSELLARTAIDTVRDTGGYPLPDGDLIESYDWIRPSLSGGDAVLFVQPISTEDGRRIWEPVENRKDKKKKSEVAK